MPPEGNLLLWDAAKDLTRGCGLGWGELGLAAFSTQNPRVTTWVLTEDGTGFC